MRYIPVDKLCPGDVIASPVSDISKRIMLKRGTIVTQTYITHLTALGFPGVYIEDKASEGIEVDTVIRAELRSDAMEAVKSMDVDKSIVAATEIMREIVRKRIVSLDMAEVRSMDEYTYAHSVSVTIISCVIAFGMHLSSKDMVDIAVAAILHDFGKFMLPQEIVNKKERLTNEEYELMKTHVFKSYDLIADRSGISEEAKAAILLHHENEDGSGYPNGAYGPNLPLIAKIIHVADIYDALVSDRPYKKGYSHWEAAEYLMGGCGILVDKSVVDCFINMIPIYPKGAEIMLSNGDICLIVDNTGVHNLRPVVRRITDLKEFDLSERENLSLTITAQVSSNIAENEEARRKMITAKKKIMVVDDMKTNLQMLKDILEADYSLILLKSGKQALSYLEKSNSLDLIIMDIDMPEMTGIDTVKAIKILYGDKVPILFVSSLSDKNTVLACRELHAAGYIVRPYKTVYILEEIQRILDGRPLF